MARLAAALALVAASAADNGLVLQTQSRSFIADFNGNSGGFKLYLAGNTSNTFYNIQYQSIEEVAANGNTVATANINLALAASSGTYPDNTPWYKVVGSQTLSANGNANIGSPVLVVTHTLSFKNDVVIINNGTTNITIPVTANTLKASLNLTGWQVSSGSAIVLRVKVSDNVPGYPNSGPGDLQPRDGSSNALRLPATGGVTGQLIFETTALIGPHLISQPVSSARVGNGNIYTFSFPASDRIWWDPTVATSSSSSSATTLSAGALAGALVLLALLRRAD